MITHLKFAGLACRDQELQLKFWTGKMGFWVTTDQSMGAQRWIELAIAGSQTGLVLFTPEGHEDRIGSSFRRPGAPWRWSRTAPVWRPWPTRLRPRGSRRPRRASGR